MELNEMFEQLLKPVIHQENGITYCDRKLHPVETVPVKPLVVRTLDSFAEYVRNYIVGKNWKGEIIHIISSEEVCFLSKMDEYGRRNILFKAIGITCGFPFNRSLTREEIELEFKRWCFDPMPDLNGVAPRLMNLSLITSFPELAADDLKMETMLYVSEGPKFILRDISTRYKLSTMLAIEQYLNDDYFLDENKKELPVLL